MTISSIDTEPEKISHIRQISALTRKLAEKDKIIGRYISLYEQEQESIYSETICARQEKCNHLP